LRMHCSRYLMMRFSWRISTISPCSFVITIFLLHETKHPRNGAIFGASQCRLVHSMASGSTKQLIQNSKVWCGKELNWLLTLPQLQHYQRSQPSCATHWRSWMIPFILRQELPETFKMSQLICPLHRWLHCTDDGLPGTKHWDCHTVQFGCTISQYSLF
jgi:hypothetical protein